MPIQSRYLFIASMDVDPDKDAIFNEVYDTEHIPSLLKVPGVRDLIDRAADADRERLALEPDDRVFSGHLQQTRF